MTVETLICEDSYIADGTATPRSIGFPLLDPSYLLVWRDGAPLTLGADFSVVGDFAAGTASFVPSSAWANGAVIRYARATALVQRAAIPPGQPLPSRSIEQQLDRQTHVQQEMGAELERSIQVPRGEAGPVLPPMAERAGQFLVGLPGGAIGVASGTGNDAGLRTDLAVLGAPLIAFQHDGMMTRTLSGVMQPFVDPYHYPFNARGDGLGNDMQALIDADEFSREKLGGGIVRLHRQYALAAIGAQTHLIFSRNVSVMGGLGRADPGNTFEDRDLLRYFEALKAAPKLLVDPDLKISSEGSAEFANLYALRSGLKIDGTDSADDYEGTLFDFDATDAISLRASSVLGFWKGMRANGTARVDIDDVIFDCINGIHHTNSNDKNHRKSLACYNVLQTGLSSHDPRTLRHGNAFLEDGNFNGGPTYMDSFGYGYDVTFNIRAPGGYMLAQTWGDGPTDEGTREPLNPDSIAYLLENDDPTKPVAEVSIVQFSASGVGTGVKIGSGLYGMINLTVGYVFQCGTGIDFASRGLILGGVAVRSFSGTGIKARNKDAMDSASGDALTYDAKPGSLAELDAGGGDPSLLRVRHRNANQAIRIINAVPISAEIGSGSARVVPLPAGRNKVDVTGDSGDVLDALPRIPGEVWTLTLLNSGTRGVSGPKFRLTAPFTGVSVGSNITVKCNPSGTQWEEVSRAVLP